MPLAPQQTRTFFVTTATANRRRLFQVERNAELFLEVLNQNRAKGRFHLHAFVIMPDHIHLLLTPSAEIALEKAMQFIKGGFSFQLKSQHEVWTRSFNEHRIQTPHDYQHHVAYIEQNPVRAHLTEKPQDYKFSSSTIPNLKDPCPSWLS